MGKLAEPEEGEDEAQPSLPGAPKPDAGKGKKGETSFLKDEDEDEDE